MMKYKRAIKKVEKNKEEYLKKSTAIEEATQRKVIKLIKSNQAVKNHRISLREL